MVCHDLHTDPIFHGEQAIKGRGSRGNIITKHAIDRIVRAPKDFELEG